MEKVSSVESLGRLPDTRQRDMEQPKSDPDFIDEQDEEQPATGLGEAKLSEDDPVVRERLNFLSKRRLVGKHSERTCSYLCYHLSFVKGK